MEVFEWLESVSQPPRLIWWLKEGREMLRVDVSGGAELLWAVQWLVGSQEVSGKQEAGEELLLLLLFPSGLTKPPTTQFTQAANRPRKVEIKKSKLSFHCWRCPSYTTPMFSSFPIKWTDQRGSSGGSVCCTVEAASRPTVAPICGGNAESVGNHEQAGRWITHWGRELWWTCSTRQPRHSTLTGKKVRRRRRNLTVK